MPDIYSAEWYEEVRQALNVRVADLRDLPVGGWTASVEVVGDGHSPYIALENERDFVVRIEDGLCVWYRERNGEDDVKLDYRFRGPASAFEGIAAGHLDPIDAALRGTIRVAGDMRLLMRNAEAVKVLLEAYMHDVDTQWPKGKPPYAEQLLEGTRA